MPHDRASSRASGNTLESPEPDESRLAHLLVDQSDELILWVDAEARLLYGNPAICSALVIRRRSFRHFTCRIFPSRTPEDLAPALWEELKQQLSGARGGVALAKRNAHPGSFQRELYWRQGIRAVPRTRPARESQAKPQPILVMPKGQEMTPNFWRFPPADYRQVAIPAQRLEGCHDPGLAGDR